MIFTATATDVSLLRSSSGDTPKARPVEGMICMRPTAPAHEVWEASNWLSTYPMAASRRQSQPTSGAYRLKIWSNGEAWPEAKEMSNEGAALLISK